MKKLTDKQKIKSYQKQLCKIVSLAIFCYTNQKVTAQLLDPTPYQNSDLHKIVTDFQKFTKYLQDDFKRIAIACGIDEKKIEEISDEFMEEFKKNPNYPLSK